MAPDRILVVDGDAQSGKGLRANLCERGFDAVAASGADDALALVPSFGPGAILLDATLPGSPE
ncbi:MAG TPA: response regulator, partial [Gemmatimonadaceae bacterium]|nr:response regulator [Gemmatimonadaceae bacterium]